MEVFNHMEGMNTIDENEITGAGQVDSIERGRLSFSDDQQKFLNQL